MATWYVPDPGAHSSTSRLTRGPFVFPSLAVDPHAPPRPPQRSSHRERLRADLKVQLLDLVTCAQPRVNRQENDYATAAVMAAAACPESLPSRERAALDGALENYLSVTPHERKFQFATSLEVFSKGLSVVPFNPQAFLFAWDHMAQYAANLLSRPWRPEYKTIKVSL